MPSINVSDSLGVVERLEVPTGYEFFDDCGGSVFSDKWTDNSTGTNVADYSSGKLRLDWNESVSGLRGCNALCNTVFPAAAVWEFEFDWWPLAASEFFDDDLTDAFASFKIVPENPTYDSGSWSYIKCEEGFSGDNNIALYLRSDSSGKISAGYKLNASGTRVLLLDESFTYDESGGHAVKFIIDFEDEWMELWMDAVQVGTRQTIPTQMFTDIGSTFQVNVHWHSHENYSDMLFDNFIFTKGAINASIAESFEMTGLVASYKYDDFLNENFEMTDSVDVTSDSAAIEEGFSMADTAEVIAVVQEQIVEQFAMAGGADSFRMTALLESAFAVSDEVIGGFEFYGVTPEAFEMSDGCDAFNFSAWVRANAYRAVPLFFFTLTGAPDNTTDIEIPISSFQARRRTGNPTYLAVTIPGAEHLTAINNRPNGEMVVDLAYAIDGEVSVREELLRVELEDIRPDTGAKNRSITLSGHKTEIFDSQTVTLENPSYKNISGGKLTYRFPYIDLYLNPGDTAVVGADSFRIDYITYIVTQTLKAMEMREV
jgi:hypothetical protein